MPYGLFRAFIASSPSPELRKKAMEALDSLAPLDEPDAAAVEQPPLEPPPTTLAIDSSAEGAMVSVDGGPAGPAQFSATVEPGAHKITVTAPGYAPRDVTVDAKPNQLNPSRVDLQELDGRLVIERGSSFVTWVDGVSFGVPISPERARRVPRCGDRDARDQRCFRRARALARARRSPRSAPAARNASPGEAVHDVTCSTSTIPAGGRQLFLQVATGFRT